jgi:hypothetical protein
VHVFASASLILAVVVRLYWVFRVQSPYDAIYSDMGGYVDRARALISGAPSAFPRLAALYPYGTHYLYAAEFSLVGFDHKVTICVIQAVACGVPAYFYVLFTARFFERAWAPGLLGLLFAVWQPIVWCAGYFVSEVPYLALLFLNAWLCLRFVETKRGGLALGVTGAILFAVRPQFILTFALLGLLYTWSQRRVLLRRRVLARYAWVLVPWVVVVGFSVGRFHKLTGHLGLISENGQLNRLFSDTTVGVVESRWRAPNGEAWHFHVQPPTKRTLGERDVVELAGYLGDTEVLAPLRRERLAGKSIYWRAHRAFNNVRLLWDKNEPWPEHDGARTGLRRTLQLAFNAVLRWVFLPLACVGVLVLHRRPAFLVVLAHLVTLVLLSMFFFPEARYRVPYDPFLILLASAGTWRLGSLVRRRLRRRRETRRPLG